MKRERVEGVKGKRIKVERKEKVGGLKLGSTSGSRSQFLSRLRLQVSILVVVSSSGN